MVVFIHEDMFGNSTKPITQFIGKYNFLSTFYPCNIHYLDLDFSSSEHAYQAAKTLIREEQIQIQQCSTPNKAKQLGKKVTIRRDWNRVRRRIMEEILLLKFEHDDLRIKLLATKDRELVEGNTWHDKYWGVCNGKGKNHLGKILMKIRDEHLMQGYQPWPPDLLLSSQ